MIEATCTACGNINRVDETDVPVGAKFVNCASCKSRVAIPSKTAIGAAPPRLPVPPPIPPRTDPTLGLSDLPAPKRHSALGLEPAKPAPRSGLAAALDTDLPAPRGARAAPPLMPVADPLEPLDFDDLMPPGAEIMARGHDDLPAPKASRNVTDLPTPKVPPPRPPLGEKPSIPDLPAPKARPSGELPPARPNPPTDLPTPKGRATSDVPPPVRAPPPAFTAATDLDLTPKSPGLADLPVPKRPSGIADLPTPKQNPTGIIDLPTPKGPGGIIDLPMPKPGGVGDLPAPKGFFDDLPQPASAASQHKPAELPAPKGFFDDLPGRTNKAKPELPAPKGFFDDLPGRTNPNKPRPELPAEPPAPKGFFDDLPGRTNSNRPEVPAPKGFFDDLPQPSKAPREARKSTPPSNAPVDLDMDAGPALDLGTDTGQFDDLDLSKPTTAQIRVETPKRTIPQPAAQEVLPSLTHKGGDLSLELEVPRPTTSGSQQLGPKRVKPPSMLDEANFAQRRARRTRIVLLVGLIIAGLGGGGFMMYRRHAAKQALEGKISDELAKARSAIAASDAAHWDRAAGAANQVLNEDPKHPEALALAAEGLSASALANGQNAAGKLAQARKYVATASEAGVGGPQLSRASALSAIAAGSPEGAIERLKGLTAAAPKDATLMLYLAWAHAARGDYVEAIKSFDQTASVGVEEIKLQAIYGRAQAKLAQADLVGARADFDAVYQLDKTHIGAQVGLAASLPIAQAQTQEEELRAILARKDLETGDPRAVIQAWVLAADAAKRGNRLDEARERYSKGLALAPDDVASLTGLAEVELRDGKLDAAAEQIGKALAIAKDDVRAQLVQTEVSIARKDLRDAAARLEALAARTPPPPTVDQARIKLMSGQLLEAQGDDAGAVEAFVAAAKLAGDLDLTPTLAAVGKLSKLADQALQAKDNDKANELRVRADQLLGTLAGNAEKDPQLALTLGMAYLQASDPVKAEPWLYQVVEARPNDAEGKYQLAKALARMSRWGDAVTRLQQAIALAPARSEISLELARTYEAANRDSDAGELYDKLLITIKDPSVELRARAGRFLARTGKIDKATEQGAKILAVQPGHAAGLYLKAEGLLAADRIEEARRLFTQASEADPDPQYLDGQGRAAEAQGLKDNDSRFQDVALRAYTATIELAPTMFSPHAGLGRLYLARREPAKAAPALQAAFAIKQDPDVAYNLGVASKELGQIPAAIAWFRKSIELRANPEASWNLAQLYQDAGGQDKQEAAALEAATRGALDSEKQTGKAIPWVTPALHRLGRVHKDLNNDAGAREAWEKYVGRNPPPSTQLNEVKRILATSLKRPDR